MVTLGGISNNLAISDQKVVAEDDADVIDLESLAGVDATDLMHGGLFKDPQHAIFAEVPACLEAFIREIEVVGLRIFFTDPLLCIACNHAGFIVGAITFVDQVAEFAGAGTDFELEVDPFECGVGGFVDAERMVNPREITIRAVAAELRLKIELGDGGAEFFGPVFDLVVVANVFPVDALVFIEEEDGKRGGVDNFFNLIFSFVAEHARLLVEPVCFIDDKRLKGVGLGLGVGARAFEEIGDAGLSKGAGQFTLVDCAWCAVFGDVLSDEASAGEFDE